MSTTAERFGVKKIELVNGYDSELVGELLGVLAQYTFYYEPPYLSEELVELLRLIRVNPIEIIEGQAAYRARREDFHGSEGLNVWIPSPQVGLKIMLSKRHPLYRMVSHHFPSSHRIWRYFGLKPIGAYGL